jgi:hypothetical protein
MQNKNLNSRMETRILVSNIFNDNLVSSLEIDRLKKGDTKNIRGYNEIINSIKYLNEGIN